DDPANAAFYTVASEHFQYHVFGTDPVRHLSCQLHAHHTRVMGVMLTGEMPDWGSAKDVIRERLRRHSVKGGVGRIIEYYGPGLDNLSAMDRHVIANMGAELGATATVFPSDDEVKRFMEQEGRGDEWMELKADEGAEYDDHDEIDLS